jgi:hypothetical protein
MLLKNKHHVIIGTMAMSLLLMIFLVGCETNTNTTGTLDADYKTFELSSNDISLSWCNHPLFSFEYPNAFSKIFDNAALSDVINVNRSEITLTGELPYKELYISVELPQAKQPDNAYQLLKEGMANPDWYGANATIQKVIVSGNEASYLESKLDISPSKKFRLVMFDYAGLIWQIEMTTFESFSDSPKVQESFNHIIDSFRIIDTCNSQIDHENGLNILVDYNYNKGIFTIINNENITLCNVNCYLNFSNDDLSSGYVYHRYSGIFNYQTIEIQDWLFENNLQNKFGFMTKHHAVKMLVQAEFPGCRQVYSYLKTWD